MHHTFIDVHGHRRVGKGAKTCRSGARPAQISLIPVEAGIFGLIVETVPVLGNVLSRRNQATEDLELDTQPGTPITVLTATEATDSGHQQGGIERAGSAAGQCVRSCSINQSRYGMTSTTGGLHTSVI